PARRLVGDQELRAAEEPLRKEHLLLVATRERRHHRLLRRGANVELAREGAGAATFRPTVDEADPRDRVHVDDRDVLPDGADHEEALLLSRPIIAATRVSGVSSFTGAERISRPFRIDVTVSQALSTSSR